MFRRLALTWNLSATFGWGVFGINLTMQLLKRQVPPPLLLGTPNVESFSDVQKTALDPLVAEYFREIKPLVDANPTKQMTLKDMLVMHSFGNNVVANGLSDTFRGGVNVGFVFFEHTNLSDGAYQRANFMDRMLAGSTWNRDYLVAHGVENCRLVLQGIDETRFHPRPRRGRWKDRFVIFSGGKFEFRKSQDIVTAAFKAFHARHPDALLVTAWQNHWQNLEGYMMRMGHVSSEPEPDADRGLRITEWAEREGLPMDAFVELGQLTNDQVPEILAEADVGLFPNRCEGGTNLVAMEAMACGLPCILSANTGHLDLIRDDNCYALTRQDPVTPDPLGQVEGWGESSVEEIVETLEKAYSDREDAGRRGARGAEFMTGMTWSKQTDRFLAAIRDLL